MRRKAWVDVRLDDARALNPTPTHSPKLCYSLGVNAASEWCRSPRCLEAICLKISFWLKLVLGELRIFLTAPTQCDMTGHRIHKTHPEKGFSVNRTFSRVSDFTMSWSRTGSRARGAFLYPVYSNRIPFSASSSNPQNAFLHRHKAGLFLSPSPPFPPDSAIEAFWSSRHLSGDPTHSERGWYESNFQFMPFPL